MACQVLLSEVEGLITFSLLVRVIQQKMHTKCIECVREDNELVRMYEDSKLSDSLYHALGWQSKTP